MEAGINATNIQSIDGMLVRGCITSVRLIDPLSTLVSAPQQKEKRSISKQSPIPILDASNNGTQESANKPKEPKARRKRSKDYAREALQYVSEPAPEKKWLEYWDGASGNYYFYNKETQVSQWEKPLEPCVQDVKRPKTPTETMDAALASTTDKKAFRAAKREAENFVGMLLRDQEKFQLTDPDGLIEKLNLRAATLSQLMGTICPQGSEDLKKEAGAEGEFQNEQVSQTVKIDQSPPDDDGIQGSQEWDSLHARSTGLMTHIPESSGTHIRFSQDEESATAQISSTCAQPDTARCALDAIAEENLPFEMASAVAKSPLSRIEAMNEAMNGKSFVHKVMRKAMKSPAEIIDSIIEADLNEEQPDVTSSALVLNSYDMLKAAQIQKYWGRRFSLWSRFDEGIQMDLEGWYSATPEKLATHHAKRLACDIAVDAFGGVGGNAVQLATTCKQVLVTDNNFDRLLLAKHNAGVYGVGHNVDFVCGDFLKMAPHFQADAVFLSPPWGGPSYHPSAGESYKVDKDIGGLRIGYRSLIEIADSALYQSVLQSAPEILPPNGDSLAQMRDSGAETSLGSPKVSRPADSEEAVEERQTRESGQNQHSVGIAAFLPKTTDLFQILACTPSKSRYEIEKNFLNNKLTSITMYHGPCVAEL